MKQLYVEMCQQKDSLEEALREARTHWETEVEGMVSRRLEEGRCQKHSISCAVRKL